MLKLVYRHNMLHERDVRKALETGQPVKSTTDDRRRTTEV